MFIHARAARMFRHPVTGETFTVPNGFIGEVPAWVEQTPYFQQNCADGTITALVSTRDSELATKAQTPEAAQRLRDAAAQKAQADAEYEEALRLAGLSNTATTGDSEQAPATGSSAITPAGPVAGTSQPDGSPTGQVPTPPAAPVQPSAPKKPAAPKK